MNDNVQNLKIRLETAEAEALNKAQGFFNQAETLFPSEWTHDLEKNLPVEQVRDQVREISIGVPIWDTEDSDFILIRLNGEFTYNSELWKVTEGLHSRHEYQVTDVNWTLQMTYRELNGFSWVGDDPYSPMYMDRMEAKYSISKNESGVWAISGKAVDNFIAEMMAEIFDKASVKEAEVNIDIS